MELELLKYLTDEDKKRIAERVYEEELRAFFHEDVRSRAPEIFHGKSAVYDRILEKYISDMNLYHESFVPLFKKDLENEIENLLKNIDNTDFDSISSMIPMHIRHQIQKLATDVIDENKDTLKPIILEKVIKCCNETLLIAFLSDLVRAMNLDQAVKKIINEWEGEKK